MRALRSCMLDDDVQARQAAMRDFPADELLGDHADHFAAGGERGVGDDAHQADVAAAVDHGEAFARQARAECGGAFARSRGARRCSIRSTRRPTCINSHSSSAMPDMRSCASRCLLRRDVEQEVPEVRAARLAVQAHRIGPRRMPFAFAPAGGAKNAVPSAGPKRNGALPLLSVGDQRFSSIFSRRGEARSHQPPARVRDVVQVARECGDVVGFQVDQQAFGDREHRALLRRPSRTPRGASSASRRSAAMNSSRHFGVSPAMPRAEVVDHLRHVDVQPAQVGGQVEAIRARVEAGGEVEHGLRAGAHAGAARCRPSRTVRTTSGQLVSRRRRAVLRRSPVRVRRRGGVRRDR